MKKTIFFALTLIFAVMTNSCLCKSAKATQTATSGKNACTATVLSNEADSVSYAFGIYLGNDLEKNLTTFPGMTVNKNVFLHGFAQALKGDSTLMPTDFAVNLFQQYLNDAQQREVLKKREEGDKFLAANKLRPEVKTTESGLQYEVLTESTGVKPKATDHVKVHYTGTLIDGTVFDSSVERGEPITFPLNGVIPGWTEGVQLMSKGAKYKFYIPSELGYGERGAGGQIPPFATLVFEVELLDINPEN